MAWLMAHQAVLGGLVVALIDVIMAVSPGFAASGVLHQIYVFCGGKAGL
jgi:hypothetical protein